MKIKDEDFLKSVKMLSVLENRMKALPIHVDPAKEDLISLHKKKSQLQEEVAALEKQVNETNKLSLHDELKGRIRVLKKLGYCDANGTCRMPGQTACEISW